MYEKSATSKKNKSQPPNTLVYRGSSSSSGRRKTENKIKANDAGSPHCKNLIENRVYIRTTHTDMEHSSVDTGRGERTFLRNLTSENQRSQKSVSAHNMNVVVNASSVCLRICRTLSIRLLPLSNQRFNITGLT